jgi:Glycosyl transferase family 2
VLARSRSPALSVIAERDYPNTLGKTDLLFTTHNRREFTIASFTALLENTNWDLVRRLLVVDDRSKDGTLEFMGDAITRVPANATLLSGRMGGPAISMNVAVTRGDAPVLAKIDNDVIVCPGWLDSMLDVLEQHDEIDALGMEPGFGAHCQRYDVPRGIKRAKWIGGVGLIRRRVFDNGRRVQLDSRWFGWTLYQRKYVRSAWITPDLPVFLLDHLPFEPWMSLSERYIKNEWQRRWPTRHPQEWSNYWEWYFAAENQSPTPNSGISLASSMETEASISQPRIAEA